RFATRSDRLMDAYSKGLNGLQAAWAGKRYRGHRVLPTLWHFLIDLAPKGSRFMCGSIITCYIYFS
ncbi:hypothetical protein B0H13DRAFT_1587601, partial [Mycena leptocephala]